MAREGDSPRIESSYEVLAGDRLWDLEKLQGLPEDATRDEIVEKAQIVQHEHEKASCERTYAMNRFRWAVAARFGLA
jgi:hypothetical protein